MRNLKSLLSTGILALTIIISAASQSPAKGLESVPRIPGPTTITLDGKFAAIDLPKGYSFIEKEPTCAILKANGTSDEGVLGLVVPNKGDDFFIVYTYEDIGHVHDDDAAKLDAKEILQGYKDATAQQNEERQKMGVPPFFVADWAEPPHYEKSKNQVVWAIGVREEDNPNSPVTAINYNTRILGRKGVLSMNLVTEPDNLIENKKKVSVILDDTKFTKGNAYSDFKPGIDKDAGIGIAGLILGGGALAAAAKFGILGGAWKFLLAGIIALKKFIIVGILGLGAFIGKMFGKKKEN